MEANTTNQQNFNSGLALAEPHFDEEATLLSAQAVVPLEEIKAQERSGKRLTFGVAIAFSLAAAALSSAFIYRQRGSEPSSAIVSKAAPGAAGITSEEPVAAIAESVEGAAAGSSPQAETPLSLPSISSRAAATVVERKRKTPLAPKVEERELTWDERFNERRLRRISEREALRESRRRRRSSDDLLRIREIFEGPSRP